MYNLKETILNETDGGRNFFEFVLPNLRPIDGERFENTLNPFYHDTNPGLSIYNYPYNGVNRWRFNDFGEETYKGDVFDFAAHYYDLDVRKDFKTILCLMAEDLKISLNV